MLPRIECRLPLGTNGHTMLRLKTASAQTGWLFVNITVSKQNNGIS